MANAIPVLTYHSLQAGSGDYATDDHVALRIDLHIIQKLGFRIASLPDVARYVAGEGAQWLEHGRWVALSFDDGVDWDYFDIDDDDSGYVKSFYTIMAQQATWSHDGPLAVSFVIASPDARQVLDKTCIAGRGNWQDDWWKSASDTGLLGVGNHSWDHVHPHLPVVAQREGLRGCFYGVDNFDDATKQIEHAEDYIRARAGASTGLFAYPYGHAPDYLVQEYFPRHSTRFGMKAAFTVAGDFAYPGCGQWAIPRFVHGDDWQSPADFVRLLRAARASSRRLHDTPRTFQEWKPGRSAAPTVESRDSIASAPVLVRARANGSLNEHREEAAAKSAASQFSNLLAFEEVSNPDLFAGELFRRHFQASVPHYPSHFVTFCRAGTESIHVIGYMHILTRYDMKFVGGIIVSEEQRRSLPISYRRLTRGPEGIMDFMLRNAVQRSSDAAAIWSYVGDPLIQASMMRIGFAQTRRANLMVFWNSELTMKQRSTRLANVVAFGPF